MHIHIRNHELVFSLLSSKLSSLSPFITQILYIGGKGDGNIRYYEITDEAPYCHFLSEYRTNIPQKGLGWTSKRACDTSTVCFVFLYICPCVCVRVLVAVVSLSSNTRSLTCTVSSFSFLASFSAKSLGS